MKTIALSLLFALPALAEGERAAVLDFAATGIDADAAVTFTKLLAAEIARAGKMETVGREDVAALLGVEQMKQLMGCSGEACLKDLGTFAGMLDVRWVVTGSMGRVGSVMVVSAQLIDAAKARVQNRAVRRAPSMEQLAAEAGELARELLSEPATLHLYNQVAGAAVFMDDRHVGVMPLAPLALSLSGKHRVRAEGADYLPWESEVDLVAGRTTRARVELERLDDLESASQARKWWAGGALALGLALGGGAVYLYGQAADLKAEYDALDPFLARQAQLDDLAGRAQARYAGTYALGLGALAAVAGGAYLFLTDPYAERLAQGAK